MGQTVIDAAPQAGAPAVAGDAVAADAQRVDRGLSYAPARVYHRRRRVTRRALVVMLALLAAGAAWWWHEPVVAHAQLLYWQRRCATHSFDPQVVVASSAGPAGSQSICAPVPAYWTAYHGTTAQARRSAWLGGGGIPDTVVFLHRRRSPGGTERVVAVGCTPFYLTSSSVMQAFWPITAESARVWPLSSRPRFREGRFSGGYPTDYSVRVLGGQPDPADPSHFSIAYTVGGEPGTIDGYLRDDGTVDLQIRPGSADMRAMMPRAE